MKNNLELFVPIMYSVKRESLRFDFTIHKSIARVISKLTRDYIWIPIFSLIMLGRCFDIHIYLQLIVYLVSFMVLYEIGYIMTDNIGIKFENKETATVVYESDISYFIIFLGIIIRVIVVSAIICFFIKSFSNKCILLYLFTLFLFLVHCGNDRIRMATFFNLRIIKGIAPYFFLIELLKRDEATLILLGLIGIASYWLMQYSSRKMKANPIIDFSENKNLYLMFLMVFFLLINATLIFNINFGKTLLLLSVFVLVQLIFYLITIVLFKDRKTA